MARDDTASFHVDTFDLYSARQRQHFIKQASGELEVKEDVIKRDLGKVLLKLEELQEQQISRTLEPTKETVTLSKKDTSAADGDSSLSTSSPWSPEPTDEKHRRKEFHYQDREKLSSTPTSFETARFNVASS